VGGCDAAAAASYYVTAIENYMKASSVLKY
jgi:hypothetical protein